MSFEDIVCDLSILISYKVLLTSTHKRGVAVVLLSLLRWLIGWGLRSSREMRQMLVVRNTATRGASRERGMMNLSLNSRVQYDMLWDERHEDCVEWLLSLGWQNNEGTCA